MRAIITVLDNITETSMPFNEFVLYRAVHYADDMQILIVCGPAQALPKVKIPDNLKIIFCGKNVFRIRKEIRKTISDLQAKSIPYVIHLHQVQSGFLSQAAMLGTGLRKKTLFTVHSTFSGYKFHNKVLSFTNALLAKHVNCVSNTAYEDYPNSIKKMKSDRFHMILNGVDTERIDEITRDINQTKGDEVVFIYVARLIPIKNHKFLVDVLGKCASNVRFEFVGSEDPDRTVRRYAKEAGVEDRITFTGLIPRNEVFKRLVDADCYISSSTLEGLPVSVLESMYCGLPCILSNIPQHSEVAGTMACLLPFDTDLWAEKINHIASLTAEERLKDSSSIHKYIEENFTLNRMHEKYDRIYKLLE